MGHINKSLLTLLLLYGALLLDTSCGQAMLRSSFGEFCNDTIKCDKNAWLSCQLSKCDCMLEEMIYNTAKSKCLSKSGERCRFQLNELGSGKTTVALYENTECVSNANCDNDNTCVCNNGYYETIAGNCVVQKDLNATCQSTLECSQTKNLSCIAGFCSCDESLDLIYGNSNGFTLTACYGKAGKKNSNGIACIHGSIIKNNSCVCTPEDSFYADSDGKCNSKKDYMRRCNSDAECLYSDKRLTCVNGFVCDCDKSSDLIYGKTNLQDTLACQGMAGKPLRSAKSCIEGSTFKIDTGNCECVPEDSFYAASDGKCDAKKDYMDACQSDAECIFKDKYLTCENGKCDCNQNISTYKNIELRTVQEEEREILVYKRDGYRGRRRNSDSDSFIDVKTDEIVYGKWSRVHEIEALPRNYYTKTTYRPSDKEYIISKFNITTTTLTNQCVGLARQPCNLDSQCVKDATCVKILAGTFPGKCTCISGFSATSSGTCGIGHGRACSASTSCSDSFLCTNGVCNCPQINHQIYDSVSDKCLGFVSSFCSDNSDCYPNSICKVDDEVGLKQCQCNNSFVENSVGICELAWASVCNYSSSNATVPCDTIAKLQCRNLVCACSDTMSQYDTNIRKCLGSVGSRCNKSESSENEFDQVCVSGASCVHRHPNISGKCLCKEGYALEPNHKICNKVVEEFESEVKSDYLDVLNEIEIGVVEAKESEPNKEESSPSTTPRNEEEDLRW